MCGITGFLKDQSFDLTASRQAVQRMTSALRHRGPNEQGEWLDSHAGVALGHSRLSILDLSSAGSQPMTSASGRYVIVFNGEIYNHQNLRKKLEGRYSQWRGTSDTETILAAIEVLGLEYALKESVGMFALAVWDRDTRSLSLARDRLGEKPLYYGWQGNTFLFGSDLKALTLHPDFKFEIFKPVISHFLQLSYVPTPWSIWTGINKLEPGTFLTVTQKGRFSSVKPLYYWSFADFIKNLDRRTQKPLSDTEAIDGLEEVLTNAVRQQSVADVPVGAFLSGGIDSSLIVSLMQAQSDKKVETFSIGFDVPGYNEAPFAKQIAEYLGTRHTELYVSSIDAQNVIPLIPFIYDEPFGDSSQVPTYLVSKLAKKHVTVVLSGDGGDELFGGYARYAHLARVINRIEKIPVSLRITAGYILSLLYKSKIFEQHYPEKLIKLMKVLIRQTGIQMYPEFVKQAHRKYVLDDCLCPIFYNSPELWPEFNQVIEGMMFVDTMTAFPGDILTKVDRATMAVSLEARAPLLDHRVIEYAWRLPYEMKIRDGQTKWILRKLLERYVPRPMFERPKTGFSIPLASWLRKDLRPWAEELLSAKRLQQEGLFNPDLVRKAWHEHLSGKRDHNVVLWNLLMFQAWQDKTPAPRNS